MTRASQSVAAKLSKTSEGHAREVEVLIAPAIEALGYEVVRVMIGGDRRPVLQVMVERQDEVAMTVEHCAEVSRAIEAILDVEDPIAGAYALEVSSPGIDRPLTRLGDFVRFAGYEARVEMRRPIEGQRRFRGRLAGVSEEDFIIEVDGEPLRLPFADLDKAKLLLTDELIAASMKAAGENAGR